VQIAFVPSMRASFVALGRLVVAMTLVAGSAGCVGSDSIDSQSDDGQHENEVTSSPGAFFIGVEGTASDRAAYEVFRAKSPTSAAQPRLCHVYTFWDAAERSLPVPPGKDATTGFYDFFGWMAAAEGQCDEVMISFKGQSDGGVYLRPRFEDFQRGFKAMLALTAPNKKLANWAGRLSFTAWNEPNNLAGAGNGLGTTISAEDAAHLYLVARQLCQPNTCKIAAGDFATNGNMDGDIEFNCADDNDPANTPTHCAHPSTTSTASHGPSYLDRYKNYIAVHASEYGLGKAFRPEYFAYHPWQDVNDYVYSNKPCAGYDHCVTQRLIQSLGSSWGHTEIWDTEIGIGFQKDPAPNPTSTEPCGAAFLVQLTELSNRITRVYFLQFGAGRGPLVSGNDLNAAGQILASRATSFAGASCADTGMHAPPAPPDSSGLDSLGGKVAGTPVIAANADGRLQVFVRGPAGDIATKWQVTPNGGWSSWASLGGGTVGAPSVARNLDGRLELVARATDNSIWHNWQTAPNAGWTGWYPLGGIATSDPVIAKNGDGRLEIFVLGTDGALDHRWQLSPGGGWADWSPLGSPGGPLADPVAITRATGEIAVFAVDASKRGVHFIQQVPGGWSAWQDLGGTVVSPPTVAANQDGRLEVFGEGTDAALWHRWESSPNGPWGGWASLAGLVGMPTAAIDAKGALQVFVRGTNDTMFRIGQVSAGSGWGAWEFLGGGVVSRAGVGVNADGRLEVFVRGSDQGVHHDWETSPGSW
jgi:hypothetical protein